MEGRADDFCVVLVKVVSLENTPSRVRDPVVEIVLRGGGNGGSVFFFRIRSVAVFSSPCENGTILADSVYLKRNLVSFELLGKVGKTHRCSVCREVGCNNSITMPGKGFWSESSKRIQGEKASRHVPRSGDEAL